MPHLSFTLPLSVSVPAKPCTTSTQSRRAPRPFRIPPRAVAMTADIPTSDDLQPTQSLSQTHKEPVVLDPEDHEFVRWVSTAEPHQIEPHNPSSLEDGFSTFEEDSPADDNSYLEFEDPRDESHISDEDEDIDAIDDEEDEEDEDDEDDELAARDTDDEFDDDFSVQPIARSRTKVSVRRPDALAGVDEDDNDEVQDADEFLEPIPDEIEPVFEPPVARRTPKGSPEQQTVDMGPNVQESEQDLFGNETEEDIQNAANILSESGILGLGGLDAGKRYGIASGKSKIQAPSSIVQDEDFSNELALGDDDDDDDDVLDENESESEKDGLDSYVDTDSFDDDEEFALTSKSSFGRLWEFNEDGYITITEPGQPYMYEMDVEDQEDQEMASIRRGKAGGWSGGLMSNSSADLEEGSKEWIARRAYELVAQSNQVEMFQWTRRHKGPPPVIAQLFPPDPPPPKRLARTTLPFSTPGQSKPTIGMDSSGKLGDKEERKRSRLPEGINYKHALDKSIKFPCQYKFKVEGSGEHLEQMLARDLERVLGRTVPPSAFHVEPAGRYKRVIVMVQVTSALQVTEVYDALRNNAGVKFSYG